MTKQQAAKRIKRLRIPQQAKVELMAMWDRTRRLTIGVLKFIERHRQFGEAVILGAIIAFLLAQLPWIGGFLALCALVTAAAIGVMKELKEDLNQLFAVAQ